MALAHHPLGETRLLKSQQSTPVTIEPFWSMYDEMAPWSQCFRPTDASNPQTVLRGRLCCDSTL